MVKRHRVAVLPGDGIGPEVTREAVETLKLAAEIGGFGFEWTSYPFGAEHYLRTQETFPPSPSRSTTAVLRPSWAARIAPT